ncbi:hypothetical protein BDV98DRAFT_601379 [Pterulicium gracile]|uniref:Uncharacterized protein n=1 Tax=Pterulicium gracile TaxID=1884261 RepID=A0A5C3QU41_9AGAR|nr:hypothetical protein BDV98DRAFT_601379 [Pterula gracilis]
MFKTLCTGVDYVAPPQDSGDQCEDAVGKHKTTHPYCPSGLRHQVRYDGNPKASAEAKKKATTKIQQVQKTKAKGHKATETAVQIALQPVISPTVLPSPGVSFYSYWWKNASCWFDAMLHLIYMALIGDEESMDAERVCLEDCLHKSLPGYQIIEHFISRRDPELKCSSLREASDRQTTFSDARDVLRPKLFGTEDPHRDYFNLTQAMDHRSFSRQNRLLDPLRLLRRISIELSSCSGSDHSNGVPHYRTSSQSIQKFRWELGLEDVMDYDGYQDRCNFNQQPRSLRQCFRTVYESGEPLYTDSATIAHLVLQSPIILVFDVQGGGGTSSEVLAGLCNFPSLIHPFNDDPSFRYEIQGRGLFSLEQGHYICRVRAGDKTFLYDSMKRDRRAVLESKSMVETHLAGLALTLRDVPPTFHTCAVTYRLVGGIDSQARFYSRQCTAQEVSKHQLKARYRLPKDPGIDKATAHLPVTEPVNPAAIVLTPQRLHPSSEIDLQPPAVQFAPSSITSSKPPPPAHPNRRSTRLASNSTPSDEARAHDRDPEIHENAGFTDAARRSHRLAAAPASGAFSQSNLAIAATTFVFQCRCGKKGQDPDVQGGRLQHVMDAAHLGGLIQCDERLRWMHIA